MVQYIGCFWHRVLSWTEIDKNCQKEIRGFDVIEGELIFINISA